MDTPSPVAIARRDIPLRALVAGVLLALGATTAGAASGTTRASSPPVVAAPAPVQSSTTLNLAVPSTTSQPSDLAVLAPRPAAAPHAPTPVAPTLEAASDEVRRVSDWVAGSRDNSGLPYLVIDKVNALVFAFDGAGKFQGATPALLGLARGDRLLAPNSATMAQMPPGVRITPAGRFVSRLAIDSLGKELLVMDYDASISLHAVIKGTPEERRAERLNSATPTDNRISYGCINVPTAFYATVVSPAFRRTKGIVYVLPETKPAGELFGFQPAGVGGSGTTASAAAMDPGAARPMPVTVAK